MVETARSPPDWRWESRAVRGSVSLEKRFRISGALFEGEGGSEGREGERKGREGE